MQLETSRSQMVSVSLHIAVLAVLMLLPSLTLAPLPLNEITQAIPLTNRKLLWTPHEAGGGAQQQTPATAGKLVVQLAPRPLVAPTARPLDRTPKLIAEAAISVDSAMPRTIEIGDPLSNVKGAGSTGRGIGVGGVGDGVGPGVGDGNGPGLGGLAARPQGFLTPPVVIFRVEPDYPDEARKARFQGSVLVAVEVDEQGRVRMVRITKPAGLGLDEKALEAVRQWRFKPATRNGRPVAVPAQIEVSFHLL